MHQDYAIIATHLGTQIKPLYRALTANSEITVNSSHLVYTTPLDLHVLQTVCNRAKKSRVLVETIALNHLLRTESLSEICTFIYYLGEPRQTITSLIQSHKYDPKRACDYYGFRLQRLSAMAKSTPKSIFLTWQSLNDESASQLTSLLHLKNKIHFSIESDDFNVKPTVGAIGDKACRIYDKYAPKIQQALEKSHGEINIPIP